MGLLFQSLAGKHLSITSLPLNNSTSPVPPLHTSLPPLTAPCYFSNTAQPLATPPASSTTMEKMEARLASENTRKQQHLLPVVLPWQGQLSTKEQEEQATLSTKEQGVVGVVAWSPGKVEGRVGGL